jgi:hypothetical protein
VPDLDLVPALFHLLLLLHFNQAFLARFLLVEQFQVNQALEAQHLLHSLANNNN